MARFAVAAVALLAVVTVAGCGRPESPPTPAGGAAAGAEADLAAAAPDDAGLDRLPESSGEAEPAEPEPMPAQPTDDTMVTEAAEPQAQAAGAPRRGDSKNEPVYLVHGYTYGNCGERWNTLKGKLRDWGWTGPLHTVGYYYANETARDTGCDVNLADARNRLTYNDSIMEVGRRVAWDIHNRYARHGRSVDVVAHSMGGLVMRAALTGVANRAHGFPPYLYVEDVVTLATPHQGFDCRSTEWLQCREMRPGSKLLGSLKHNPQSAQRTDWTLLSSEDDQTVSANSGIDLNKPAGHKIKYLSTNQAKVTHSLIRTEYRHHRKWNLRYWNYYFESGKGKQTGNGWSPLHATGFAIYYANKW